MKKLYLAGLFRDLFKRTKHANFYSGGRIAMEAEKYLGKKLGLI
jgi:hypothetical protein